MTTRNRRPRIDPQVLRHPLVQALETSRKSERTVETYRPAVIRFLTWAAGRPLSGPLVDAWAQHLARAEHLKQQSINVYLSAVKAASTRAAGLFGVADFAAAVELSRELDEPAARVPPTLDEVRRLIAACAGEGPRDVRDLALVTLLARRGLRRDGARRIDFEHWTGGEVLVRLKGGKKHRLALDAETLDAFERWRRCLEGYRITTGAFFRAVITHPKCPGFLKIGGRIPNPSINALFEHRSALAGVRIHPHLLRHAFVQASLDMGMTPHEVAGVTGHVPGGRDGSGGYPSLQGYSHPRPYELPRTR